MNSDYRLVVIRGKRSLQRIWTWFEDTDTGRERVSLPGMHMVGLLRTSFEMYMRIIKAFSHQTHFFFWTVKTAVISNIVENLHQDFLPSLLFPKFSTIWTSYPLPIHTNSPIISNVKVSNFLFPTLLLISEVMCSFTCFWWNMNKLDKKISYINY